MAISNNKLHKLLAAAQGTVRRRAMDRQPVTEGAVEDMVRMLSDLASLTYRDSCRVLLLAALQVASRRVVMSSPRRRRPSKLREAIRRRSGR